MVWGVWEASRNREVYVVDFMFMLLAFFDGSLYAEARWMLSIPTTPQAPCSPALLLAKQLLKLTFYNVSKRAMHALK